MTFDLYKDDISFLDTKTGVRESPKSLGIEILCIKNILESIASCVCFQGIMMIE